MNGKILKRGGKNAAGEKKGEKNIKFYKD